jgi:hypothetical protein
LLAVIFHRRERIISPSWRSGGEKILSPPQNLKVIFGVLFGRKGERSAARGARCRPPAKKSRGSAVTLPYLRLWRAMLAKTLAAMETGRTIERVAPDRRPKSATPICRNLLRPPEFAWVGV